MAEPVAPGDDRRRRGALVVVPLVVLAAALGALTQQQLSGSTPAAGPAATAPGRPTASPTASPQEVSGQPEQAGTAPGGTAVAPGTSTAGTATVQVGGTRALVVRVPPVPALSPGVVRTLVLTVTNPDDVDVRLEQVSGRALELRDRPLPDGCPIGDFAVGGSDRSVLVAAGSSVRVPVTVSLRETGRPQDACKGASFTLSFTAAGRTVSP